MAVDSLRDGFIQLCFSDALNAYAGKCRLLIEGQYYEPGLGGNVVPDTLIRVVSLRAIDVQFGQGSVLAESLKVAFGCCANNAVDIYAIPRADAPLSVRAAYTLTITGPATSSGRMDFYWGDSRYNISVGVTTGQTAAAIAALILAAIPTNFPYTATVLANVITFTARNSGTVGNFLNPSYNWHGRLDYAPLGVTVAFAQTVLGSVNPVPLNYSTVLGTECCYCCFGLLSDDVTWQDAMIQYLADAWDCTTPQCFGHGYTYNSGSLGTILATSTNSAEVSRIATCIAEPIFPWLKVAAYAAHSCCSTVDNPELSVQGPTSGVLNCLKAPASCVTCFTYDEQVQLRENGFVVSVPLYGGSGFLSSPIITNDVTNYLRDDEGRENATFRDVNSRRLATRTAIALATKLQEFNALGLFTSNTDIKEGVKGTNPRLILGNLRAWAKDNIGTLFSEFDDLDSDLTVLTDFQVAPACQGIPGKLYVNLTYRPPVRINKMVTALKPALLDNC